MKTIKVKFIGYWDTFEVENQIIYHILKKKYNVELCDDPDYLICSCCGKPYDFINYSGVRIMAIGENYIPDFNLIDYGISQYPISFLDRYFYAPLGFGLEVFDRNFKLQEKALNRHYEIDILKSKPYFANFICSHESEYGIRGNFFKKLSEYKRIESIGPYLYNMPNGERVVLQDDSKVDFQKKSKFTLCFESTKHEGFVTEKIIDAFYSDTIPVYYGSSTVKTIFNEKAFINVADYESFDEVIELIKKLDNNDELYLDMLNQPVFNDPHFMDKLYCGLEEFIYNIFDQPLERAYRRSKIGSPAHFERYLLSKMNPDMKCKGVPTKTMLKIVAKRILKKNK